MDERDQERQLIDAETEGTGRLRGGVAIAHACAERVRLTAERTRLGFENGTWFLRERIAWPVEDGFDRLGRRGAIGVFGGGGIAVAGVVAALLIAGSGGSGTDAGRTEAFVVPQQSPTPAAVAPAPTKQKKAAKPSGPTLHGAPPDFAPAKDVRSGVGDGTAVGGKQGSGDEAPGGRGSGGANAQTGGVGASANGSAGGNVTSANDGPAATAKIGSTPEATASAQAQTDSLATAGSAAGTGVGATAESGSKGTGAAESAGSGTGGELTGPPAPKAAKRVARRFAEAFVVYEVGGVDSKVRRNFNSTSTKQLSRSLLHRPPRQPASVKVPQAKVVNVVAGPSKGAVYTVSVSLLRVGVTSELRLEMEQGVAKKWQVTNVLG
jgi:hypothetical protein